MPEFEVTVLTFRSGTHTIRVEAPDPAAARLQIQAECDRGACHCPAEWCTDDVGPGSLYADDTLRRTAPARG